MIKPMLACDWDEDRFTFSKPMLAQPKIDGVRALNLEGRLTGRSLKPHKNKYTGELYNGLACMGFDGEMAAEAATHPRLCSLTTSALNTIEGTPYTVWWLFDYVTPNTFMLPYEQRINMLRDRVQDLRAQGHYIGEHLRIMPSTRVVNMEEFLALENKWLEAGFEGAILRDPNGLYKQGRATQREGTLLRVKRFVEREAVVLGLEQGSVNTNIATLNELGHIERSTHQLNMVPSGMVGALNCKDVETGQMITVAAGSMPHSERQLYWQEPHRILYKTIKYKTFPRGVKDKPRFPTFQSIRAESDM